MKKIGPRLSDKAAEFYDSYFSSRGGGAEFVLEAFPQLYRRTISGLQGKFTAGEISLLIDTFNSTMIMPQLLGQSLLLCADDSMTIDHTDVKWHVTATEFLAKLDALSHFERCCLEIFVRAFWESGEWEKDGGFEHWVAIIARA